MIYESINLEEENCFAAIKIQYFAVDLKFQNDGLGAAMMHRLLSNLLKSDLKFNIGFKLIYLEALSEATDFYQTLGFEYLNPWEETDPTKKSSYMFLPYESLINYYDF
ncbi:hypothetical protein ABM34_10790 [Companilactobacillus ginsenosidimutans]|uniref:N-acetyltransferase domain-containing protein n=1 Tax=Companilactobacillus ginsenosidimutans TaxID=1007676 RepID=A0A0H4QHU7_9LACO|nr:hypothetical protein ABM34_10790 [Companilactobacillus ginsenosidimutans]